MRNSLCSNKLLRIALMFSLVIVSVAAVVVQAQERTGEVVGTVTDKSGGVVPNATVTVTENTSLRVVTTPTGSDGKYVVRNLAPGRYTVRFEATGFAPTEYPDVIIVTGKVLSVNAQLEVGGTKETVIVTSESPLIDLTTTLVGQNVTKDEFERLPKTRSFISLASLTPSANAGNVVEGGIMINGASGAENQFAVDGISTNSLIEGQSRQDAMFEILDEVQVKTSGIEAQYGGALGGVVSAVTKSGGDAFHGEVHYYLSGSPLNTGPSKRLLMDPVDQKTLNYYTDKESKNIRNEAGYSLGGYFIKNKLYFFSSASPQFVMQERTILASDDTPVNQFSDTRYQQAYNKIAWDISKNLRFTAAFLWSPSNSMGVLNAFSSTPNKSTSGVASLEANKIRGYFNPQSNYNATLDWTVSPTSLLSIKAARFWDNYKALGVSPKSAIEWGQPSVGIPGLDPSLQQPKGYTTTPRTTTTTFDIATRNLIQVDFSKLVRFAGTHDFKIGIGRQKNVNKVDNAYPGGGYVTLNWNQALVLPDESEVSGPYGYYQIDDLGTKGSTGGTIDHIYVQDRWKMTKRLSVDVGVRFEKEVIPSFRRDIKEYAFEFGWGEKVAPRLGASYDLFGDGKVKIYGSWGMFYDWVKYELARGTFGGDMWRTYYRPIDSLDSDYILGLGNGNMPGINLWPTAFQDWRIPAFGSEQLDPDIKPMSSWILNGGVEWQLSPQLVISARYTHNQLRNTIEDIGTLIEGSEYYIYGNPGKGLAKAASPNTLTTDYDLPTAKRKYDALELSFTRRFAKGWQASGSYVYSRLWGNYSGLQNTDEILPASTYLGSRPSQQISTQSFRPGTSASRAWDLDYYNWDSHGNFDVTGRLGADRPHVVKLYGSYTLPKSLPRSSTTFGLVFRAASGVPISTLVQDFQRIPLFVNGRGDLGRTPVNSNTDLTAMHEIKVAEGKALRIEFNLQNLFNQRTSQYTFSYLNYYRDRSAGIVLANVDLRDGYDYIARIDATSAAGTVFGAYDPRFGKADNFSSGFAGRFGVKFVF